MTALIRLLRKAIDEDRFSALAEIAKCRTE
jgi:hypothetical protein